MPKNIVSDPITDQEIAFARLVLSGTMTDRQAAEAVGLNPDSAAYTKAKPRVHNYMLEHRAAVQQQLVQQEVDLSRRAVEGQRRLNLDREKVLNRLWEIANLSPEMTQNSITGQVKALSMIIAMQNFIPACPGLPWDRRAASAEKNPAPAPAPAQIYEAACLPRPAVGLRKQQATTHATTNDPQPSPAPPVPACRGAQQEDSPARPACPACPGLPRGVPSGVPQSDLAPGSAEAPLDLVPSQPSFAHRVPLADGVPPYVPQFAPDTRVPFTIKVNPFKHRR